MLFLLSASESVEKNDAQTIQSAEGPQKCNVSEVFSIVSGKKIRVFTHLGR